MASKQPTTDATATTSGEAGLEQEYPLPATPPPGQEVAVPVRAQLTPTLGNLDAARLEELLKPATLDYATWLEALLTNDRLEEQDPDEVGIGVLASILLAESKEQALSALDLKRAKELAGGEPGGHSPLLVITGARGMVSSYEEGAPCYAIVQAVVKATGERIQFTTGAKGVQALILKMIGEGWMPFEGILTIRRHPTRRGYYPLGMEAGG